MFIIVFHPSKLKKTYPKINSPINIQQYTPPLNVCKKIILCNFDGRPNKTVAQIRKSAGAEVNFYIMAKF